MRPCDEQDLRDYFTGALGADMGLRSDMGHKLDEAQAASPREHPPSRNEYGWPVETIRCRQSRSGASASSTDLAPRASAAARRSMRVGSALAAIGYEHATVLRAWYSWHPPGAAEGLRRIGEFRHVAMTFVERDALVELHRIAERPAPKDDPIASAARAGARQRLGALEARCRRALERARDAYSAAVPDQRAERRSRYRASLGLP